MFKNYQDGTLISEDQFIEMANKYVELKEQVKELNKSAKNILTYLKHVLDENSIPYKTNLDNGYTLSYEVAPKSEKIDKNRILHSVISQIYEKGSITKEEIVDIIKENTIIIDHKFVLKIRK